MTIEKFIADYLSKDAEVLASFKKDNYIVVLSKYKEMYVLSWYNKFFNHDNHHAYLGKKKAEESFTNMVNTINNF